MRPPLVIGTCPHYVAYRDTYWWPQSCREEFLRILFIYSKDTSENLVPESTEDFGYLDSSFYPVISASLSLISACAKAINVAYFRLCLKWKVALAQGHSLIIDKLSKLKILPIENLTAHSQMAHIFFFCR